MSATAEDRGWGPHGGLSGKKLTRIACPGIPLRVRTEVAPQFAVLVDWLGPERARLHLPALTSAGAYNDRLIDGSDEWSNHAWGLAADLNPATNPRAHNAPVDMPSGMSSFCKALGMRWGGDYQPPTRRDGMHAEVLDTPAQAAARVRALHDAGYRWAMTPAGLVITARPSTGAWAKRLAKTATDRPTATLTVQEDAMYVAIDDTKGQAWLVNGWTKTKRQVRGNELAVCALAYKVLRTTPRPKSSDLLLTAGMVKIIDKYAVAA